MTKEEAIKRLEEYKDMLERVMECECPSFTMAIEALQAEHKHCWDCKHYEPKYNVCHAPEVVKQVTSKLKNPCDSLLTEDNDDSKEQKSKLESADDTFCKSQLITCNRVKKCNGVCPFEDALKHADRESEVEE